ncbi:MAG: ATP-dependent zinc metalloprotease FtsH [Clostridia bacterium]|nr:ATP-dependent zinc metalloprotease FtsH [Clostridia bacterium]
MKKSFRGIAPLIISVILIFFVAALVAEKGESGELAYSDLITNIENNNVDSITLSSEGNSATVKLKDDRAEKKVNIPDRNAFMLSVQEDISTKNIKFKEESPSAILKLLDYITPISIVILFILFWVFMMQTMNGGKGAMSFTRNRARLSNPEDKHKITFKDVAGLAEEREELQEIVEFLKYPKKFTEMGARIPKGLLLVGQPGTGKTLLAKAVAGEAGVPFYSISGSDFVEMYVGVGASRVRGLFEEAKAKAPCIVFIDEIDAVGRQRGAGLGGGHDEREQTLNQLLVEMDGFGTNSGVIVLAATNRPDILDPALLRPGRFDRQIVVPAPDVKAREEILSLYAKKKKLSGEIDIGVLAKNTAGFTGADLENMMNEAALLAARQNKQSITMQDLEDAMVKVLMGPEKKSKVISDKDKKLVAYHEGGHAVVSRFLENAEPVHQISIVPRGTAGGFTMYKNTEDKSFMSKSEMEDKIVSLLGGRVAEQLILNDISTGASNDIERASKIARSMVMKYGMSEKLGTITFGNDQEEVFLGRDINNVRNYSEDIAAVIDLEIKRIIDTGYNRAKTILEQNIDKLHRVAAVLLEKEKIEGEEFERIMRGEE